MKRKLMALLCACILLSGCQNGSEPTVQTQPTVPATTQSAVVTVPLLEQGEAEGPNLLHIPNETLDSMVSPSLRLLGNGLLLSEHREGALVLNHISLADGSLLASAVISAGEETKLTIGSGEIGLCDRETGLVTILDGNLQTLRTYPVTAGGDGWYLDPELDTLYIFFYDRGLMTLDLETGEEAWLLDNGFQVTDNDSANGYVLFTYTDRADQMTYERCLDLSTATLETMPMEGTALIRQGESWLFRKEDDHVLIRDGEQYRIPWADSPVRLLSPRQHLLVTDASQRELTIFDTDGTFRSRCALPQSSHAMMGGDLVWSGYWDGYFFTDFLNGDLRLMFWDVNAETQGEALSPEPMGEAQAPEVTLDDALRERAREISDRYGVEICLGEQCTLDYTHYEACALTDPVLIRPALDVLEEALGKYPDGFFRQLCYGTAKTVRFELVGDLSLKEGVETHPERIGAFAQHRGSYYGIVLDGIMIREETLYHEISHVIDKRLAWDALIREDALYSEESWMLLQPEGFQYAMDYNDFPDSVLAYSGFDSFIEDYGMTFPTEDRAVLMESAMDQRDWLFEAGTGRHAKMQFYADCIRDCFDTTDWPEVTAWEQVLNQ